MSYKSSPPRLRWRRERAERVEVVAAAGASFGRDSTKGRPLDVSKPIAHAYLFSILGEFQGFVRDLHDLALVRIVGASGTAPSFQAIVVDGMTAKRSVDRGNATVNAMRETSAGLA